jgi:hypothetical protein
MTLIEPALDKRDEARRLWRKGAAVAGTLAERHLRGLGVDGEIPPSLRFEARAWHPWSKRELPALVALITASATGEFLGVHQTFLPPEVGLAAPVKPQFRIVGSCRGGAVRLAPGARALVVSESLVDGLLALRMTGQAAWCVLSASGFGSFEPPPLVRELTFVSSSAPGSASAREAADRLRKAGVKVRAVTSIAFL